ncbi:GNAT family N-acetyltransferase [Frankia sp. AgB1.9]|uniref:GNAT family N-acetyltransferase n=1 Tax=unclassified Frankia TaxID=2632575 RepID=UPI0019344F9F|nr:MULTISPECIES: GNAT family N-acetyltransferase [unclassified Frankia]MBL7487813.1 GNAT family N-acetyltransferase [Frankia sp. AgW1.1]MBL7547354.1 GNAT family N-acetyltransferase [Frankia sp. AgB1.9]MBL7624555.1 GNAT family N-acetyltransferase [Frankia sp. AgB1.8]
MSTDQPADVRLERVSVEATLELRQRVLRPHLTPAELVFPHDREPDTAHVVALLADGTVVGTASVLHEGSPWGAPGWRLRGMATDERVRGQGIGSRLLSATIDHVRGQGGGLLWCNARVRAVPFYRRAGLETRGEPWEEPLIGSHIVMWRLI